MAFNIESTNTPVKEDPQQIPDQGKILKVVRATTRFEIDLRSLSKDLNKSFEKGEKRKISTDEKVFREALDDVSRLCTTARNVAMRALFKRDSTYLDNYLITNGKMPLRSNDWLVKDKKIEGSKNVYNLIRLACPRLASGISSSIARDIENKWMQERFEVLIRQSKSTPHYRVGQSFPLRQADINVTIEGDDLVLSVAFYSTLHEGKRRFTVRMHPRDEQQTSVLRKLATGEWKYGQAMIERDRLRPGKWYVRLSYTRLVPKRVDGIYAAINRGIVSFITAITQTGETWIYDAEDIVAYLKQIQRRRREYQYASKASNRHARGRKRILRPTGYLEGKAERWRQTRCQVIARRLAKWLSERHVKHVFIEDFTGIRDGLPEKLEGGKYVWNRIQEWPYFQLEMRLVACLNEYGITTSSLNPCFISQTCPSCGNTCKENRDLKNWKLNCTKCKYKKHLDVAASENILVNGVKSVTN